MHSIKTILLILFISLVGIQSAKAQENEALHQKINKDMYENFSKAFKSFDYDLFASIHSSDMVRISGNGGEIKDGKKYLEGYQKRWKKPTKKPALIDFRLFERIVSDSLVSDRGVYRVTYTKDKNQLTYSYGQFHVLLRLENDSWKIIIDYDSDENKTINEESYENAFPISNYTKYCKNKK
ncbi:hypothetical protein AB832_00415 [Flavobacteriaceae bacterium (ex Bugula neritina AB1)]|nr:hypothetical protein AB832_00415 [Flavobacteriaceae bacterium (ex Bugula neritina AB1)]